MNAVISMPPFFFVLHYSPASITKSAGNCKALFPILNLVSKASMYSLVQFSHLVYTFYLYSFTLLTGVYVVYIDSKYCEPEF